MNLAAWNSMVRPLLQLINTVNVSDRNESTPWFHLGRHNRIFVNLRFSANINKFLFANVLWVKEPW